ncbi:hypothetical protein Hte_008524 [Hypoxylon texense]
MVSLWPWKGRDSSTSSFEKTLSTLSTKIATTQAHLDRARSNARRIKVLWTLYLTFAYLVYAIVLTLVVGWQNLGPWEWSGMAGGPALFRIDTLESRLKDQQAERAKTIQKLKDATKYDSTLELLEKYGGEKRNQPKQQGPAVDERDGDQQRGTGKKGRQSTGPSTPGGRTNLPPPPTANIQRPPQPPSLGAPQHQQSPYPAARPHAPEQQPTEEFAPNAGPLPPTYAQYNGPPHWYDRIMDLMLGEDEMAPKNRIVLICQNCRLVNGQAPPGTRTLAELGKWKCMSCGTINGEIDEGKKIVREVLESKKSSPYTKSEDRDSDLSSDLVRVENDSEEGNTDGEEAPPAPEQPNMRHRNKKSQVVP